VAQKQMKPGYVEEQLQDMGWGPEVSQGELLTDIFDDPEQFYDGKVNFMPSAEVPREDADAVRDFVLNNEEVSPFFSGTNAWLSADGDWFLTDQHRDIIPEELFEKAPWWQAIKQKSISDFYAPMFAAGFARVAREGSTLYAEAPRLTAAQEREIKNTGIERDLSPDFEVSPARFMPGNEALNHIAATWGYKPAFSGNPKDGRLIGWRGEMEPGQNNLGPADDVSAATEGVGAYIAMSRDMAEQFGTPRRILFPVPKNPIIADKLHILEESPEMMEPESPEDSDWLKAHKRAVKRLGVTDENWGDSVDDLKRQLSLELLDMGYDAVLATKGTEDEFLVLLKDRSGMPFVSGKGARYMPGENGAKPGLAGLDKSLISGSQGDGGDLRDVKIATLPEKPLSELSKLTSRNLAEKPLSSSKFMPSEPLGTQLAWHTSGKKIESLKPKGALWFALSKEHAVDGWIPNKIDDSGKAFLHEAKISGKIAESKDKAVEGLFDEARIDMREYILELVSNPSQKEVREHPGTKLLQKAGYEGFIYPDYDPRDFQKDLDALLVFDPKSVTDWKHLPKFMPGFNPRYSKEDGSFDREAWLDDRKAAEQLLNSRGIYRRYSTPEDWEAMIREKLREIRR